MHVEVKTQHAFFCFYLNIFTTFNLFLQKNKKIFFSKRYLILARRIANNKTI